MGWVCVDNAQIYLLTAQEKGHNLAVMKMKWKKYSNNILRVVSQRYRLIILVVIVLGLLSNVIMWSIVAFLPSESPSLRLGRFNQLNLDYGHLSVSLEQFTLPDKILTMKLGYWVNEEIESALREAGKTDAPYITFTMPEEPFRYFINPRTVLEAHGYINPQLVVLTKSGIFENAQANLSGDEFLFPFDTYETALHVNLPIPEGIVIGNTEYPLSENNRLPFAFSVVKTFRGFNISMTPIDNNEFLIEVSRGLFDKVIFILSLIPLMLIGVWFVLRSIKIQDIDIPLLLGVIALIIGIPALREALVPSHLFNKSSSL